MGCTPVRTHTVHPFPHMTCADIQELLTQPIFVGIPLPIDPQNRETIRLRRLTVPRIPGDEEAADRRDAKFGLHQCIDGRGRLENRSLFDTDDRIDQRCNAGSSTGRRKHRRCAIGEDGKPEAALAQCLQHRWHFWISVQSLIGTEQLITKAAVGYPMARHDIIQRIRSGARKVSPRSMSRQAPDP